MKFTINHMDWEIVEVPNDSPDLIFNGTYRHGVCNFTRSKIFIMKELDKNRKLRVVMHEVTHAAIESFGFYAFETFNHEQICEFASYHMPTMAKVCEDYAKIIESQTRQEGM